MAAKVNLSKRETQLMVLVGALAVAILWLYVRSIIGPLAREGARLTEQVRSARQRLGTLEAVVANEPLLQQQYRQASETVASLHGVLPDEEELPSMMELLTNLASQTQVRIERIFPQRTSAMADLPPATADAAGSAAADSAVYYKEVPIQIDAMAGYHQLGAFLARVESADTPMRVSSLRITTNPDKDPKRHVIKLVLRSYFTTSQAGVQDLSRETGS